MAVFDDLPAEIAIEIVRQVTQAIDISVVSRTSHRLRDISEPLLYRTVMIGADVRSLKALARTIISRPALGYYVRRLILSIDENVDSGEDDATWVAEYLRFLDSDKARRLGPNDMRSIVTSDESGPAAFIVILLHFLPRVEVLDLEDCCIDHCPIGKAALGRLPGGVPAGLTSLRNISMSYWDTESGFGSSDVVHFFRLPNLLSVDVTQFAGEEGEQGMNEEDFFDDQADEENRGANNDREGEDQETQVFPAGTSSVTRISFKYSVVESSILEKILRMPQSLEEFQYSMGGAVVGYCSFYPSVVGDGLRAQKHSLKVLQITNDDEEINVFEDLQGTLLGSFHDYIVLERIALPLKMLVGPSSLALAPDQPLTAQFIDLLPPSLIALVVWVDRDDGWTLENFALFISLNRKWNIWRRERLPKLKIFRVAHREPTPMPEALCQEYANAGIELIASDLERATATMWL